MTEVALACGNTYPAWTLHFLKEHELLEGFLKWSGNTNIHLWGLRGTPQWVRIFVSATAQARGDLDLLHKFNTRSLAYTQEVFVLHDRPR